MEPLAGVHFPWFAPQESAPGPEVIPVYEVLCPIDGYNPASPKSDSKLGFINLAEEDTEFSGDGKEDATLTPRGSKIGF